MKKAIWFLAFSLTCISAYSQKLPQKVEYRLENLKSIDGSLKYDWEKLTILYDATNEISLHGTTNANLKGFYSFGDPIVNSFIVEKISVIKDHGYEIFTTYNATEKAMLTFYYGDDNLFDKVIYISNETKESWQADMYPVATKKVHHKSIKHTSVSHNSESN